MELVAFFAVVVAVAFGIGFASPRWWISLAPFILVGALVLVIALSDAGDGGDLGHIGVVILSAVVYGIVAAVASVSVLGGVAVRRYRRARTA
jgi:uncharacterized membrane protein